MMMSKVNQEGQERLWGRMFCNKAWSCAVMLKWEEGGKKQPHTCLAER